MSSVDRAKELVYRHVKAKLEEDGIPFEEIYIRVVWFAKTLQNWKALLSTTAPDEMFYEVTHSGDNGETYLDAYRKMYNVVIPD